VTAQGDGTWLVGAGDAPVGEGWLWLDARAATLVRQMRGSDADRARFAITGTGLNACQMGPQIAFMDQTTPDLLDRAEVALHCKDWLYLNLTGLRVTDPSEALFSFGDFRTRRYDDRVIEALGIGARRGLLPDFVDGAETTHPLTESAARATGLHAGTPVSLGYVDVVCTALGAGIHTPGTRTGCTILGSTGMHMRAMAAGEARINADLTGYTMALPIPGMVAQMQSTMAATLNIDWMLGLAGDLLADLGHPVEKSYLMGRIEGWLEAGRPGALIYLPYISEAGERGPFVESRARAGFAGLSVGHRFPDLMRAVAEGLGLAARDCYAAMGEIPDLVRLSGGAARSPALRALVAAALAARVQVSARQEAGAAGAAMMAAVAIGSYDGMDACIADWVTPHLGETEAPDPQLAALYEGLYPAYLKAREASAPVWSALAEIRGASNV
jgi:erythritol kinase